MVTKTNKKPSVPKRKVLSFEKFVDTINNAPLLMQAVDDMFNKFADELDEKEKITPYQLAYKIYEEIEKNNNTLIAVVAAVTIFMSSRPHKGESKNDSN